jgi:hypothetical protein
MPTFVTLVPGNDFAGYAGFGASGLAGTLDVSGSQGMLVGVGATLQTLAAMVPNGVVTTLPDPTNTAQWNTVSYNSVPLDQATADQINSAFTAYNGGLLLAQSFGLLTAEEVANRTLATRVAGNNPILIQDETLTDLSPFGIPLPLMRDANANDKISLFAGTVLGQPADPNNPLSIIGVTAPLEDQFTLMASEIEYIQSELNTANTAIVASVPSGWALLDLAGLYNDIVTTGVMEDDFMMTGDLVFGG